MVRFSLLALAVVVVASCAPGMACAQAVGQSFSVNAADLGAAVQTYSIDQQGQSFKLFYPVVKRDGNKVTFIIPALTLQEAEWVAAWLNVNFRAGGKLLTIQAKVVRATPPAPGRPGLIEATPFEYDKAK